MIRSLMLEELTKSYGPPTHAHSQDWWTVYMGTRAAVRICLNEKIGSQNVAHVLVFNPSATNGKSVIEMRPTTVDEAANALQQVKHILEVQE